MVKFKKSILVNLISVHRSWCFSKTCHSSEKESVFICGEKSDKAASNALCSFSMCDSMIKERFYRLKWKSVSPIASRTIRLRAHERKRFQRCDKFQIWISIIHELGWPFRAAAAFINEKSTVSILPTLPPPLLLSRVSVGGGGSCCCWFAHQRSAGKENRPTGGSCPACVRPIGKWRCWKYMHGSHRGTRKKAASAIKESRNGNNYIVCGCICSWVRVRGWRAKHIIVPVGWSGAEVLNAFITLLGADFTFENVPPPVVL